MAAAHLKKKSKKKGLGWEQRLAGKVSGTNKKQLEESFATN